MIKALFYVLVFFSSCTLSAKELSKEDLFIIRLEDGKRIFLEESIYSLQEKLGKEDESRIVAVKDGDVSGSDTIVLSYDGLELSYLRDFENLYLAMITNKNYSTSDGITIGDYIQIVEKKYSKTYKNKKFISVISYEGDIGKGFVFYYNNNGVIEKISLLVFSQ